MTTGCNSLQLFSVSLLQAVLAFSSQNDPWRPPLKDSNVCSCVLHVQVKSQRMRFSTFGVVAPAPECAAPQPSFIVVCCCYSHSTYWFLCALRLKDGRAHLTLTADILKLLKNSFWKDFSNLCPGEHIANSCVLMMFHQRLFLAPSMSLAVLHDVL